jgi:hypothetical protein
MLYITMVLTVAVITFSKGHWLLGIFGIFFPLLWLIGAILPAKSGSRWEVQREMESRPGYTAPPRY